MRPSQEICTVVTLSADICLSVFIGTPEVVSATKVSTVPGEASC